MGIGHIAEMHGPDLITNDIKPVSQHTGQWVANCKTTAGTTTVTYATLTINWNECVCAWMRARVCVCVQISE